MAQMRSPPSNYVIHTSPMQAELSNPDSRPLPLGWADHFDPRSRRWYYINLDVEPRATFTHPCDESTVLPTQPISPLSTTTNLTHSSSISSRSGVLPKAKRKENGRVRTRLVKSQDTTGMSPWPMSVSPGPSRDPLLPTVAQRLYASSLGSSSPPPPPSRRPSVTSTHASTHSDPDETSTAGGSSSTSTSPPKPSAFRRHPHGRQARKNSSATNSPSLSPASANNILLDSHDPRNFFDCTRLSGGTRRFIHEGPPPPTTTTQGVSTASAASTASPSSLLSPYTHRHSLASPAASAQNDGSSNENLLLNFSKLAVVASDSTSPSSRISFNTGQFNKEAQALYHPAIFSKPVTTAPPSTASASVAVAVHQNRQSMCFPIINNPSSIQDKSKLVQSISSVDKRLSDTLRLYSAVTEDEKLRAIPNPSSGSLLPIPITEDQTIIQATTTTTTNRRESRQFPPTINVLDVQNSSSPSCIRIQTKLARRNTYCPDDKRLCYDTSLHPAESLVLRQPRPIRPISAIPARFNLQLEAAEQGPSGNEDQMTQEKGSNTRRSSVLRRLSTFGTPRTREQKSLSSTILDPS